MFDTTKPKMPTGEPKRIFSVLEYDTGLAVEAQGRLSYIMKGIAHYLVEVASDADMSEIELMAALLNEMAHVKDSDSLSFVQRRSKNDVN